MIPDHVITFILAVSLVALIFASGFCSGIEAGFLSLSRVRLLSLVRQGSKKAKRLAKILGDMSTTLTTLLVANNLVNVITSTVSAAIGMRLFSSSPALQSAWSVFVAMIVVLCGEYLPKLLFTSRPLRRSLSVVRPYRVIAVLLSPIVVVFSVFVRLIFRVKENELNSNRLGISRDGLRLLVTAKEDGTKLTQFERHMIEHVLSLQAKLAREMMRPLSEDPYRKPVDTHPLTTESPVAPELWRRTPDEKRLRIGSRTRGDDILPMMRKQHQSVAIVVDEDTGKDLGVVTEEDVLHILTGILKEG